MRWRHLCLYGSRFLTRINAFSLKHSGDNAFTLWKTSYYWKFEFTRTFLDRYCVRKRPFLQINSWFTDWRTDTHFLLKLLETRDCISNGCHFAKPVVQAKVIESSWKSNHNWSMQCYHRKSKTRNIELIGIPPPSDFSSLISTPFHGAYEAL